MHGETVKLVGDNFGFSSCSLHDSTLCFKGLNTMTLREVQFINFGLCFAMELDIKK